MTENELPESAPSMISRVEIDRELCIGAGSCIAIAPEVFEFDSENIAILKNAWRNQTDQELIDAAKSCPTLAIRLYDADGNCLYPES